MHQRGAMGFILTALLSLIVLLAGVLSPSVPLALFGGGGVVAAGLGFFLYHGAIAKKELLRLYPDGIEFVRGPQRGYLPFAEVSGVRGMQWGASLYPYTRAARFLVLQSPRGEWQVGPEVAGSAEFQEAILAAIERFSRGDPGPAGE